MEVVELAEVMKSPPATLYRILNGQRNAGKRICIKIAKALKIDSSIVLYQAGVIDEAPNDPRFELDPVALDILGMLHGRSKSQKQAVKAALAALLESIDKGDGNGRNPD